MSAPPKNSAEVAIKLIDFARSMKIPVTLECSLVTSSDSRYVIMFPGTEAEAVIRISSHRPYEERYDLCIDVSRPSYLAVATEVGIKWIEEQYGNGEIQALAERGGLAPARVSKRRRGRDGPMFSPTRDDLTRRESGDQMRLRHRVPRGVRGSGPLSERPRGEARRVRFEQSGYD